MALTDELEAAAAAAAGHGEGVALTAVLPTEPARGTRLYVCAYEAPDGARSWLALDVRGAPLGDRRVVRDAVSIAALCELAEEAAFPGDLDELRSQLVALRISEAPEGIEEAEAAAHALQHVLGAPPHVASAARLDEIGQAARRLERALDPAAPSPFTAVMRGAQQVVDALWREVETAYRADFE